MNKAKILLDADVFIHFIKGEQVYLLTQIFPKNPIVVLEPVYQELTRHSYTRLHMESFVNGKRIVLQSFPEDNKNIKIEYARLLKEGNGAGESACMAVARYDNSYIASSNLRDISPYCKKHGITYLTTMDFLCAALYNNVLSEQECNEFILKVLSKGSKLPVTQIKDYSCKNKY